MKNSNVATLLTNCFFNQLLKPGGKKHKSVTSLQIFNFLQNDIMQTSELGGNAPSAAANYGQ